MSKSAEFVTGPRERPDTASIESVADVLERDPYYNPNLSRERADFSLGKESHELNSK